MAITFSKIPKAISPSDNPLMYEFSSDQTAQANFTFVYDVYFNNVIVGSGRLVTERSNKAHLDIREWVSSLVSSAGISDNITAEIDFGRIKLKVTESYGTTPTLQATATSTETKIFKARIDEFRFIDEDFSTNYKNLKWLTNVPGNKIKVKSGSNVFLSMIIDGSAHLYINFYNGATLLGTFEDDYVSDILQVNANNELHTYPTATSAQVLFDDTEVINIEFVHDYCLGQKMLYWVNEYGQIDQYFFDHNSQESGSTTSFGYAKPFGEWVGTDFEYNTNAGDRNHLVQTNRTIELHSDYMSGAVQNWLNETTESSRHWVEDEPHKLETASYIDEDERFEDLIAYTVKLAKVMMKNSARL